jgi:hypothetical protein
MHSSPCSRVAAPSPTQLRVQSVQERPHRLQPLHDVVQQLLYGRLTDADLLQNFFSRRVQPLCGQVTTMWMYPRPSCPDCPFSEELGDAEINTRIHRVLAPRVDSNSGAPCSFQGRG